MNSMIVVIRAVFFDIDNLILNVIGGVIGFVFVKGWFSLIAILFKPMESKKSRLQH